MSNSLQLHGLYSPQNSLGQNTTVGSLSLFQGIFPTQGLNPGLPHCRRILYQLSHKGSPVNVVPSAYLRLLIFLPAILILACASSSPAFLMMYYAYKLNIQDTTVQFLGQEDLLEKGKATHFSILAWRIPWTV